VRTAKLKGMDHWFFLKELIVLPVKDCKGILTEEKQVRIQKDHITDSTVNFVKLFYLIVLGMD
jgi:hypothetical protein